MNQTKEKVFEITKSLIPEELRDKFSQETHIFSDEMLDSFGLIELVEKLDSGFSITINSEDLTIENFATVDTIATLVEKYQK
jgi:acyl carrier protein